MKISNILIAAIALAAMVGCKAKNAEQPVANDEQAVEVTVDSIADTDEPEAVVAEEEPAPAVQAESYFDKKAKTAAPAAKATAGATAANRNAKAETIYVETDGAQGRVWGHVTMKGDRGTGTIHDWDENTLAVSVTRHGDELFAVDQNSRQYVFKLKQNKTQE